MTIEKAHTWLENKQTMMTQNRWAFSSLDVEANGMAILALEKQIAKKPKNIGGELFCPVCDRHICEYDYKTNYCEKCGQALDWSDKQ